MDVLVIGAGYTGLVTAACLAHAGHSVRIYDSDGRKMEQIRGGVPPFFEPGLGRLLEESVAARRLVPAISLDDAFASSEIILVCVGTPPMPDGGIDLSQLFAAADSLSAPLRESKSRKTIVVRSTVVPGTSGIFGGYLAEKSSKRLGQDFGVAANPEFLRQGNAVEDFQVDGKIIVGAENGEDIRLLRLLYAPFGRPVRVLPIATAEMAKYVSNCFLAAKISFVNEMGLVSKRIGVDINDVVDALELKSSGRSPLMAGCGFGGSCLEKDARALIVHAGSTGTPMPLMESVLEVNSALPGMLVSLAAKRLGGLKGRKVGLLGLSFKPGTDDIRNSRAIPVLAILDAEGAALSAYDPRAASKMKKLFPRVDYAPSAQSVVDGCDAVIIVTAWEEFAGLDYRDKIVIDGRNVVPQERRGRNYTGLLWP